MKTIELLKKLNEINKSYYTFSDLKKIINLNNEPLKVKLNRLVKQNVLKRAMRGVYVLYDKTIDCECFACEYVMPSYVSFEYALSVYGIISEIPYEITLATTKRTKKIKVNGNIISYRKIRKDLFFGYEKTDKIFIATKEKAYLDCVYFRLNGKQTGVDVKKVDTKKLDKKILLNYAKKYPEKIKKYVMENF
ncbi:MAG: hypothetical protein KA120_01430 [Candidatus Goldbacteria bacterium]|nr:hypothetical protein [Candidatus Goldiibacteriota bacterium]HPD18393.1 hypothetical protein [Candidatus Goldiibacteriota bacterium]